MRKSSSIYVRDNVDKTIQRIDSLIDFNPHKIDLFDSQFCSKEDEDCSLQSYKCIGNLVNTKKPLGVGYVFKSHCFPLMNVSLSFKVVFILEYLNRNWYFHHFAMIFTFVKNIILNVQQILYILNQNNICYYNCICLM